MFQVRRPHIGLILVPVLFLALAFSPAISRIAAQAPFDVEVDITSATVVPKTGIITVTGTVTCSEPATVFLSVDVNQPVGRVHSVFGYTSMEVECTGVTPFTLTLQGENGTFKFGDVRIRASVSGCVFNPYPDPGGCDFDQVEERFRLRRG